MRKIVLSFVAGMIIAGVPGSVFVYKEARQAGVLGERIESSPTPAPTESPTVVPTPTNTPTPAPTEKPTPRPTSTQTPAPIFPKLTSAEIYNLIERFAGQYGVDPNVLRHIAKCESGFNPSAVNGPYVGLYQFAASTWRNNRVLLGEDPDPNLRYSAEESIQTAAYLMVTKGLGFWPNCTP